MATLPFLIKKDSRVFLPVLLTIFFSFTSLYSQTVIREKVKIFPKAKISNPRTITDSFLDPTDTLCQYPGEAMITTANHDIVKVLAGNRGNYWYEFTFLRDTETPWHVSITGQEYVKVHISQRGTCDNFYDPGYNFTLTDACMYITFDKTIPLDKERVAITFSGNYGSGTYLFDVYNPQFLLERKYDFSDVLYHGDGRRLEVQALNICGSACPSPFDSTLYVAKIITGIKYGKLLNIDTYEYDSIMVLNHFDGYLGNLAFVANGIIPDKDEQVVISVGMSDSSIQHIEFAFTIKPDNLLVTFDPPIISPGDTATVVLKKKNADGTLSDFPQDQTFDIQLTDGADYGTLYFPDWDYMSDRTWGTSQNIKFIAEQEIPGNTVQSTLSVNTSSGGIATAVVPGNNNSQKKFFLRDKQIQSLKKIRNTQQEDEMFWGSGTITITKNSSHVKAYFEKENLSPGDTVNVIIKKVDAAGNESNYPVGTLFDAGIIEGCGVGDILSVAGRGKFFPLIPLPVRFIVSDSLSAADSVVLRIGAPDDDSSPSVQAEKVTGKMKNTDFTTSSSSKTQTISRNKRIAEYNYCAAGNYTYDNVDFPLGKVGGDCNSYTCDTNETPAAPTFSLMLIPAKISSEKEFCDRKKVIDGSDYYEIGGISNPDKPFESFDTLACYNKSLNKWIIKPNVKNKFVVQLEVFWCEDNVNRQWNAPINSLSDLNSIPSESICKALMDFVFQRNGYRKGTTYAIREVMVQHEVQHIKDFENLYGDLYKEFDFANKYLQLEKSCESFKNITQLKKDAGYDINKMLDEFVLKVKDREIKKMGTEEDNGNPDSVRLKYETETQSTAFRNYGIDYMIKLYGIGKDNGQEKCVEEIKKSYWGLFKRG